MALKFGPQWLRDLSDGGTNTSQPSTPTASVKFKLADYRYGREEMLALFNEHSTPPDQVRKHLSIFSKEIQKPITMLPLTEDEQRLISQGFNSTVVLRAASRGSGPPIRSSRGGGTSDRGRGRGRGRGEGYISRTENGDVGYSRSTQDGWEQVGRKFERSYSRGYDDIGPKREYIRSSSDNWRDKKFEDDEEDEEGGTGWRNNRERWGSSTRANWREGQRDNYEIDRRPIHQRGFDQESRGVQRANENYDNEGDVPEWVADDVGDDPGTFDSSGAFVSTRQGKKYIEIRREPPPPEDSAKNNNPSHTPEERTKNSEVSKNSSEKSPPAPSNKSVYVPPNARNGNGDSNDSKEILGKQNDDKGETNSHSETQISFTAGHSNKGDGDSGFAIPNPELVKETRLPPGQNIPYTPVPPTQSQLGDTPVPQPPTNSTRLLEMDRLQLEKSLQNFVAEMTAGAERRAKGLMETSLPVNPPNSEDANKWFYKDPQGEVQGPFTNEEMAQWFSAGYFTMSLIVKRGCDDSYKPLGELIKRYGRVPFLPGPPLPPLITGNMPAEPTVSSTPPLAVPPLVPPMSAPLLGQPLVNVADPHIVQQMFLQQEFIKQTYLRKLQQLQQLQDPESFKNLTPEHIPMQLLMQANPLLMQHQLLLQQQQQEHSLATAAAFSGDDSPAVFPHSSSLNSSTANTIAPSNIENEPAWPSSMSQIIPGSFLNLNEALRQQELKKLQQQKDQLANIQLPASTKWAAVQQTSPMYPTQSKSLTEIQEEARQEEERLREQQIQMQRIQEQFSANQSQQQTQKSWATSSSQALPVKGLSLLHIQQQEAEKAKKSEKEKTNNNAYTAKVAQSIPPTWTGSTGTWTSSQPPCCLLELYLKLQFPRWQWHECSPRYFKWRDGKHASQKW
uniref:GYF domain-containing protein n=1 Tax=Biomphalaria glabrata TaxID=6526 RepID=A0A2C9KNG4_BIOGL